LTNWSDMMSNGCRCLSAYTSSNISSHAEIMEATDEYWYSIPIPEITTCGKY